METQNKRIANPWATWVSPAGNYMYSLVSGGGKVIDTKKMTLLK